jgi:hypothetical protein
MRTELEFSHCRQALIFPTILLLFIISCSRISPEEKEIRNVLNSTLNLDMFDTIQQGKSFIPFNEFRKQYEYISVVYLEDGCSPCYPKFVEWHNKMDSISPPNNYTVLFIIQGGIYNRFMAKVWDIDPTVEAHYHYITTRRFNFIEENINISKRMPDKTLLINRENKIKMIGVPWLTKEMTELFFKICEEEEL